MARAKRRRPKPNECETCGQLTSSYDLVHSNSAHKGRRQVCSQCLNTEVAKINGYDKFEHVRFDPVALFDSAGESHVFYFQTRLFMGGLALEAFEFRDGREAGYGFQIIGGHEEDQFALFGRLIDKMRRGLSRAHIEDGEFGLQITNDRVVRGMIASDESEDYSLPLVIIDGREFTWDQFGRLLTTFEGWQFKLEIRDRSEEV